MLRNKIRVRPIAKVDPRYNPMCGKYPARIRIAMADGTTQWYVKEIQQPSPVLREPLARYTKLCIGYERKEEE